MTFISSNNPLLMSFCDMSFSSKAIYIYPAFNAERERTAGGRVWESSRQLSSRFMVISLIINLWSSQPSRSCSHWTRGPPRSSPSSTFPWVVLQLNTLNNHEIYVHLDFFSIQQFLRVVIIIIKTFFDKHWWDILITILHFGQPFYILDNHFTFWTTILH